ncbi:MAG: restriction endonuclease [Candidatus Magasanikbacteria bacterium CG10_big_fil_rev_8_21_14_0_10_36_16]|uniref:Restriction endonuclease n=1 Tax=Candidatus Magasanikbacteria bacterium CG10_big_fil_rev_8_21_14_0_10_36_16 TaxID=1974645 RepID=A0A2H0TXI1_9BACT|nr:MAG: restriction endonuclease [Candidatus Magasanikbacteria bacterium CG10_big_fil_rev_8_21_14_0_10_36_16]
MQIRKTYRANDNATREKRKKLRSLPTKAEYVLWQELRKEKTGFRFRRQVSIGAFIVDFYCHELKLIIEIDGPIHENQKEYDYIRENYLKNSGYKVIRFTNEEVLFYRENTILKIKEICNTLSR